MTTNSSLFTSRMDVQHMIANTHTNIMFHHQNMYNHCDCGDHESLYVWHKNHPIVDPEWTVETYEIKFDAHMKEYQRVEAEKAAERERQRIAEKAARIAANRERARVRARERTVLLKAARARIEVLLKTHALGKKFKSYRSLITAIYKPARRFMAIFDAEQFLEQAGVAIMWKTLICCPFDHSVHPNMTPNIWRNVFLPSDLRGQEAISRRADLLVRSLQFPLYIYPETLEEFQTITCQREEHRRQKEIVEAQLMAEAQAELEAERAEREEEAQAEHAAQIVENQLMSMEDI